MKRKIKLPPPLPEVPSERLAEVSMFKKVLSDKFYDYGYLDVYDSVFRQRVDTFLMHVKFETDSYVLKIGKEIQETNSTEVKLYIKFFKAIEDLFKKSCPV